MQILKFPIVRLTLLFLFGMCGQKYVEFPLIVLLFCAAIALITFIFFHFSFRKKRLQSLSYVFLISAVFVSLGALCLSASDETRSENHYLSQIAPDGKPQFFELVIRERLKPSKSSEKFVCEVEKVNYRSMCGKILMHVPKSEKWSRLRIGQRIKTMSTAYALEPPKNPGQFDYSAYLKNKNIYAVIYATEIRKAGIEKSLGYFADAIRSHILSNIAKSGFPKNELAVFGALMLGQQQDIDSETVKDYQFAGAVHILSVSGLHIGFLMLLLDFAVRLLPGSQKFRIIRLILVVIGLWSFAVIAGLSASVVRSVTMFSFISVGLYLGRNTNILNTLCASMLIILIFKPGFLFDVGFQLSYAALFFIVWLKPIFDRWMPFQNKILRYFGSIHSVSLAAQIGTLPLSFYYFHQFPSLFFATNLIVIPFLGIIMTLGLITLTVACFFAVPTWLGLITSKSIWLLDTIIACVGNHERLVFQNIGFTTTMLLTSYLLIFMAASWTKTVKYSRAIGMLIAIFLLQCSISLPLLKSIRESEWILFHARGETIICERSGRNIDTYTSCTNDELKDFITKAYATKNFSKTSQKPFRNTFTFSGKKILVLDGRSVYPTDVHPDILILSSSPKTNPDRTIAELRPKIVVADGSNFTSLCDMWKRGCLKNKIPFHATAEKGSFILRSGP